MECSRVLVVSDSPDRRNFLEYQLRDSGLTPIWFPNPFSATKALANDPFSMIIADLSIPVGIKVDMIEKALENHPNIKVITIGKTRYLDRTELLSGCSSVISLDSIESFPDALRIVLRDEVASAYASSNMTGLEHVIINIIL